MVGGVSETEQVAITVAPRLPAGAVGRHDMDRAGKMRHRVAIGLRPDVVLLQHQAIPMI